MQGRSPPAEIYLDTSVLLAAVIRGAPHAQACAAFCEQLIAANSYVYFSQLVRLQLPQALRKLATRRQHLPAGVRARYRLDDWGTSQAVRGMWLRFGLAQFEGLVARFHEAFELPWHRGTRQASLAIVERYGLQMLDATHVATAQEIGLHDFAGVDSDFGRVSTLAFWLVREP